MLGRTFVGVILGLAGLVGLACSSDGEGSSPEATPDGLVVPEPAVTSFCEARADIDDALRGDPAALAAAAQSLNEAADQIDIADSPSVASHNQIRALAASLRVVQIQSAMDPDGTDTAQAVEESNRILASFQDPC